MMMIVRRKDSRVDPPSLGCWGPQAAPPLALVCVCACMHPCIHPPRRDAPSIHPPCKPPSQQAIVSWKPPTPTTSVCIGYLHPSRFFSFFGACEGEEVSRDASQKPLCPPPQKKTFPFPPPHPKLTRLQLLLCVCACYSPSSSPSIIDRRASSPQPRLLPNPACMHASSSLFIIQHHRSPTNLGVDRHRPQPVLVLLPALVLVVLQLVRPRVALGVGRRLGAALLWLCCWGGGG